MSITVILQVAGKHDRVMSTLELLKERVGASGAIWVDERNDPFPGSVPMYDEYSGEIEIEMYEEKTRVGAIGQVIGMVNACDPEHEVVVGGDIFKRPLE